MPSQGGGGELEFESGYVGEIEKEAQVAKEEHREPGAKKSLYS
jgi:hypothetical protein